MEALQAFHNAPEFKEKLVAAAIAHREADSYIRGVYSETRNGKFRGCSLGCAIESVIGAGSEGSAYKNHRALPGLMGLPVWLGYLQDQIFEKMDGDYTTWNERLFCAISVGADLNSTFHRIMARIQREIVTHPTEINDRVALLHDRAAIGDTPLLKEWTAAATAARKAVGSTFAGSAEAASAWSAAWAAIWAVPESDVWEATGVIAGETADAAGRSATWAANGAAAAGISVGSGIWARPWAGIRSVAWGKTSEVVLEEVKCA